MSDLPPGWEWATLDDLGVEAQPGFASGRHNRDKRGILHLRPMNVTRLGVIDTSDARYVDDDSDRRVHVGDILFNNTNSAALVGKTALVPPLVPMAYSNHMTRLRAPKGVVPAFLAYQLHWLWMSGYFRSVLSHHVNQASVPSQVLLQIRIAIPGSAEQRRIVAVLDSYLSRLDAGLSEAAAARRRVDILWQSVLNRQLPRHGHGDTWSIRSLDELSHDSSYGTSVKCAYNGQGVAVVRIPNIIDGQVDPADMKYATDAAVDLSSLYLASGDILFVRTNGSRSLIGRTAAVDRVAAKIAFASYLIRFRLRVEIVRPKWIHYVLESPAWRRELEREAASSAGQYNLSLTKLGRISIPLPGLAEQDAVLAELDDQRSANDRLESSLVAASARGEALRRSLLTDAFCGLLVPQDPNAEPASVLLEQIKTERAAHPKPRRGRRSTKRTDPDQESML